MIVFSRPASKIYRYDFWLHGQRYAQSTGLTNKRDAETYTTKRRWSQEVPEFESRRPDNLCGVLAID